MTTATSQYRIEWGQEEGEWLVLDADGEAIDTAATEKAARKLMVARVNQERHEALLGEISEKLWDADLATLEKIRGLLGA